jgi:hydrogenase nickel incorporation protein HypB
MCATCGCGQSETTLTMPGEEAEPRAAHGSEDGHRHGHGDDHGHDHAHDRGHAHYHHHEHDHDHEHGHLPDHDHDHAHDHGHDHSHKPGRSHVHTHPGGTTHAHGPAFDRDHADIGVPGRDARTIALEAAVLAKNQGLAERNRGWFAGRGMLALNLMSSPGAGKTTLLERSIRDLGGEIDISVVEGDQATTRDAERIRATGARAIQVNTGTGCHLEAEMLARALDRLKPARESLLMIENVGNLVCPALFDLGEGARVVIFSVTEGEDKPLKYPHMFRAADVLLLSKIDLLPHLRVDRERMIDNALTINPELVVFPISAYGGDGLDAWYGWLRGRLREARSAT